MKKAFSLMELVIVMGLITILTAVTIISLESFSPTIKLNNSTKLILNKLRQAQEEAIAIQARHTLRFDDSTGTIVYQLIKINEDDSENPQTLLETKELVDNLTVSFEPAAADNKVTFSSDGAPDWSGKITVGLSPSSKIIDISPAGVIKIE